MTWQYVLTIFVGAILGGTIGLEREYRSKEAGQPGVIIQRDPARMAAQVVSGIGFIGAGTIIFQRNVVKGLTTAAGLWVTSAIGMTAGVEMYDVAIAATALVLICLEGSNFLHHRVFKSQKREYDVDEKNE